jgi:hypothetical protein
VIDNNGGNASNDESGGGSGGSILIKALMFSGHGSIQVNGGDGRGSGGGGAGGRLAVHVSWLREYAGRMLLHFQALTVPINSAISDLISKM